MIFDINTVMKRYQMSEETEERALRYLKALKLVIGADGEIAAEEWLALEQFMEKHNVSQQLVSLVSEFDIAAFTLEQVLPDYQADSPRARSLVRDAIEIARADGTYAPEENAAVMQAAKFLGVKKETVYALEALVEMEAGVYKLKQALLSDLADY